ncbi:hypothetical protein [Natronorubrum sp. DTA28]|uniref:hypothetical protein n=1 Tax=Natronorubrum sp. DTA28 TaxID=3447019 RepID=UPI003F875C30
MTDDPPTLSRRGLLGAAAGTAAMAATAGCLSSLVGTSSAATEIEPVEPSEPREGSPGEFYFFLEEHDIEVDELLRENDELYLTYRTDAETVSESNEEITVVYEIYKQALIHRDSPIEYLYAEIANPFDEQALGWGINTEWVHEYDSSDADADSSIDADNQTSSGANSDHFTLWNLILNTKVYEDDLEDGDDEQDPEDMPDEDVDLDDEDDGGDDDEAGDEDDEDDGDEESDAEDENDDGADDGDDESDTDDENGTETDD